MRLIEINLILTWSLTCVVSYSTGAETFAITDTKIYVLLLALSTQEKEQLNIVNINQRQQDRLLN